MKSKPKKKNPNTAKNWDKSAWLAKSKHEDTSSAIFVSPICAIKLAACDAGLHSIAWQTEEDSSGESKLRQGTAVILPVFGYLFNCICTLLHNLSLCQIRLAAGGSW